MTSGTLHDVELGMISFIGIFSVYEVQESSRQQLHLLSAMTRSSISDQFGELRLLP